MAKTTTARRTGLPLDAAARKETVDKLQPFLYNLVDLRLAAQQVHWNIQGSRFYSVHEMLGTFYADLDGQIDVMAERILALGHAPDGRPALVAKHSVLPPAKEGFVSVEEGIAHLLTQYAAFDAHTEETRAGIEDVDAVSHDMLVGVMELSQKHQWMLRSHVA